MAQTRPQKFSCITGWSHFRCWVFFTTPCNLYSFEWVRVADDASSIPSSNKKDASVPKIFSQRVGHGLCVSGRWEGSDRQNNHVKWSVINSLTGYRSALSWRRRCVRCTVGCWALLVTVQWCFSAQCTKHSSRAIETFNCQWVFSFYNEEPQAQVLQSHSSRKKCSCQRSESTHQRKTDRTLTRQMPYTLWGLRPTHAVPCSTVT